MAPRFRIPYEHHRTTLTQCKNTVKLCDRTIESVFATVRHRTVRTKGALSQKTAKLMVFTLIQAASKKWLRLKGRNQLPKVIDGIKFNDGVEVTSDTENHAA